MHIHEWAAGPITCTVVYRSQTERKEKTDGYNHPRDGEDTVYPTTRDIWQSHASVMPTSSYRYQHTTHTIANSQRLLESITLDTTSIIDEWTATPPRGKGGKAKSKCGH